MEPNTCRDMVRYMPVWKPDWEDEDDVPALISEEEFLANLIAGVASLNYDVPITWTSAAAFPVSNADIRSFSYSLHQEVGLPRVDLQRGERYVNMDFAFEWLTAPILAIDSSFACRNRCPCDCHKKIKAKL